MKESKGEIKINPRMKANWRVEYKLYVKPTSINKMGELKPWKNIIRTKDLKDSKVFEISRKGIAIMWETEEYATNRLKSDW